MTWFPPPASLIMINPNVTFDITTTSSSSSSFSETVRLDWALEENKQGWEANTSLPQNLSQWWWWWWWWWCSDDGGDFEDYVTNPILFFCHFNYVFRKYFRFHISDIWVISEVDDDFLEPQTQNVAPVCIINPKICRYTQHSHFFCWNPPPPLCQ